MNAFYINKSGNKIELSISQHAICRMQERYARVSGEKLSKREAEERVQSLFRIAKREVVEGKKLQQRASKHAGSLYFKHSDFRFVVSENVIVTVEVASQANRHCNHRTGGMGALIARVCSPPRYSIPA